MLEKNLDEKIEKHPFKPFLPANSVLLMCGSFPPTSDKWGMDFYYPNFYNDMWRVYGLVFFNDKDKFVVKNRKGMDKKMIMEFLENKGIALTGAVTEAIREKGNASDKYLKVTKTIDLPKTFKILQQCENLVTTGEKAASVIAELTSTRIPKIGEKENCMIEISPGIIKYFHHWRMPSTSRAYPMKLETKASFYKKMMQEIGLLE